MATSSAPVSLLHALVTERALRIMAGAASFERGERYAMTRRVKSHEAVRRRGLVSRRNPPIPEAVSKSAGSGFLSASEHESTAHRTSSWVVDVASVVNSVEVHEPLVFVYRYCPTRALRSRRVPARARDLLPCVGDQASKTEFDDRPCDSRSTRGKSIQRSSSWR